MKLPGWVVDNRTSVLREVEEYRAMAPEQRLERLHLACKTALKFIEGNPDRRAVLEFRDPLPRSSVKAMERLRREAKQKRG